MYSGGGAVDRRIMLAESVRAPNVMYPEPLGQSGNVGSVSPVKCHAAANNGMHPTG